MVYLINLMLSQHLNIETALINNVVIKGIKGITNIVMDEETKYTKTDFEYNISMIDDYNKKR